MHTAGPWEFTKVGGSRYVKALGKPGSLMCDEQYYPWCPDDDADWRLIAASPDLYEAAKWVVMEWRLHGQLTDSCRHLEAAIAKAEGNR